MRFFLIFSLFFVSINCNGQDYIDLITLQYQNTPRTDFKNDSARTQIEEFGANITLPMKINSKLAIISGFTYENTRLRYSSSDVNVNLTGYTLKTGINVKHNDKLSGTYVVLPKWAIGIKEKSSSNFQLGGAAILKYKKNNYLKYVFGMYYNSEFFGPFTTPLFGLYYKKDKIEADVMLPAVADVNYTFAKKTTFGFHFRSIAKSYNFANGIIHPEQEYMVQMSNDASLYLGKEFFKCIIVKAYIGHTMGRSYRVYDFDDKIKLGLSAFRFGDNRTQLNTDFKNGLFYRIGMAYRLHLKKD